MGFGDEDRVGVTLDPREDRSGRRVEVVAVCIYSADSAGTSHRSLLYNRYQSDRCPTYCNIRVLRSYPIPSPYPHGTPPCRDVANIWGYTKKVSRVV